MKAVRFCLSLFGYLRKKLGKMKHKVVALCVLLFFFSVSTMQYINTLRSDSMQTDIASQILRFHVIANSDSTSDQALKLIIKDALIKEIEPKLKAVSDIEEVRSIIRDNLSVFEMVSNRIITEHGYSYEAKASITKGYFPLKVYGDLSLPPGEYEAVRIELGEAVGQNWWCIMFPPLCFVDATYSVVPEESKEQLKEVLTEEEFDSLFTQKKARVKFTFKLLSLFEK